MTEIINISQVRIELAHNFNDGLSSSVAFGAVSNFHGMGNHVLHIASVLWQDQPSTCCIVFHSIAVWASVACGVLYYIVLYFVVLNYVILYGMNVFLQT